MRVSEDSQMLNAEEKLWWSRGFYLGVIINEVHKFLAEVAPSAEQGAALAVMFDREIPVKDDETDEQRAELYSVWRSERVQRGVTELRALLAQAEQRCTGGGSNDG